MSLDPLKSFVRAQLDKRAPAIAGMIHSIQNRRLTRRFFGEMDNTSRGLLFPNGAPIRVLTGPFEDMRYFHETCWGPLTPKWLGSYEAELHPVVRGIIERGYKRIVDVGCAEGYYAVGLATRMPSATVFAFDTDFISRRQLLRLAQLNGVANRIRIGSFCDSATLQSLAGSEALLVCDIEGFERELLDPVKCPALRQTEILVEVHETTPDSRVTEELLVSRFQGSHRLENIPAVKRGPWLDEHLERLGPNVPVDMLRQAVDESRAVGCLWLWMRPVQQ